MHQRNMKGQLDLMQHIFFKATNSKFWANISIPNENTENSSYPPLNY